jgi:hypothetical protein
MSYVEQSYNTANQMNMQQLSMLQIRLDTTRLLEDLEMFLKCERIETRVLENGEVEERRIDFGTPRANELGIQSILSKVQSILNSSIVQGNFTREQYEDYIYNFDVGLSSDVMGNRIKWGISLQDYDFILNEILDMVIPFMSRLIDNKERDSYTHTMKMIDSQRIQTEAMKQGFSLFGGGNK